MKYLLLVCWDAERMNGQAEPDPGTARDEEAEGSPWLDDLQARGAWVTGDQLAPPRRGRSVRVRGGKKLVTDGPFAETKEAVEGFDLIECGSFEEAVEIAAGHRIAEFGTIEVRPLWATDLTSSHRVSASGTAFRPAEYRDLVPTNVVCGQLDPAKPPKQSAKRKLDLRARKGGADAEVRSELQVPVRRARNVEVARFRELARISAGRTDGEPESLAGSDLVRVELEVVAGRDATHLDRSVVAQNLLDGAAN